MLEAEEDGSSSDVECDDCEQNGVVFVMDRSNSNQKLGRRRRRRGCCIRWRWPCTTMIALLTLIMTAVAMTILIAAAVFLVKFWPVVNNAFDFINNMQPLFKTMNTLLPLLTNFLNTTNSH